MGFTVGNAPLARPRSIPGLLVRDLAAFSLLGKDRPSARYRLEHAIGGDFAQRLVAWVASDLEPYANDRRRFTLWR
jgi:hypothetical protein